MLIFHWFYDHCWIDQHDVSDSTWIDGTGILLGGQLVCTKVRYIAYSLFWCCLALCCYWGLFVIVIVWGLQLLLDGMIPPVSCWMLENFFHSWASVNTGEDYDFLVNVDAAKASVHCIQLYSICKHGIISFTFVYVSGCWYILTHSLTYSLYIIIWLHSVFGEDALVNVSVEKKDDNDGKLAGYIRIRSKTQGIALSLGDRITTVQRGLQQQTKA